MAISHVVTAERFLSGGAPITIDVFAPGGSGRHPGVVILYGSFGLLPEYRDAILSFGAALSARGVIAFLPHYFERTGTVPGPAVFQAIGQHYVAWHDTCADALRFVAGHPQVDAGRIGIVGFSLGGHLALSHAMTPPAGVSLKCAVDFFAPVVSVPLRGNRATMPPVLIHHGDKDPLVSIAESHQLVSELRAAGKTEGIGYTLSTYAGQGHGFVGADLAAARAKTVEFVTSIL